MANSVKQKHQAGSPKMSAPSAQKPKGTPETKTNLKDLFSKTWWVWIVVAVTYLVFVPLFSQDYINYDDDWMIYENPYVTSFSASSIKGLFTEFYYGQYSPVAMTILGTFYTLGDGNIHWIKAYVLVLHILTSLLIFLLFKNLFSDRRFALLAMAFFALHPVQAEAVAWLSAGVKIVVFSFFAIAALHFWERFVVKRKPYQYILALILMALSCLSKEQAFVIPVFMLLISWFKQQKILNLRTILQYIPFVVMAGVFVYVTFQAVSSRNEITFQEFSLLQRLYYLSHSFVMYLKLMAFPVQQSLMYGIPDTGTFQMVLFPLLTLAFFVWMIKLGRKNKTAAMLFLFFLTSMILAFSLQLVALRDAIYADRYLYLGVPGFMLLVITLSERFAHRRLTTLFLIIVLIFSGVTNARVSKFKNGEVIWTDAIEKGYKTPLPYTNRGHYYRKQGKVNLALSDYNEALKINPRYYVALNNRGKVLFDQGKVDLAIEDYNRSLAVVPDYQLALSNRGSAYGAIGRYEEALADLTRVIRKDSLFEDSYLNRALVFYSLDRFEEALADVNSYLALVPDDADMLNHRALCYSRLQKYKEAVADYNAAIRIDPSKGAFYMNRSLVYNLTGDKKRALDDAKAAQAKGFSVHPDYFRLLSEQGR